MSMFHCHDTLILFLASPKLHFPSLAKQDVDIFMFGDLLGMAFVPLYLGRGITRKEPIKREYTGI